jgi:hypothetical protein
LYKLSTPRFLRGLKDRPEKREIRASQDLLALKGPSGILELTESFESGEMDRAAL